MDSILLCGLMGAGKSRVGRGLAAKLGLPFADLDQLVVERDGESIPQIFEKHGESEFRRRELELLEQRLQAEAQVLALGGGAVCSSEAQALIVDHGATLVWLRATPETCAGRLVAEADERPLLQGVDIRNRLQQLLDERWRYYGQADLHLHTDGMSVEQVVQRLSESLVHPPAELNVGLGERSYPIRIGFRGTAGVAATFCEQFESQRAVVVTDSNVADLYLSDVVLALKARGVEVLARVVDAGEASKQLPVVSGLYDELISWKTDRRTPVIALGGGVVGDLAGFVAATLYRGVPLMQVPTTLLSQVDSAVGGKTGVNHALGKNLIGAFYQPGVVYVDPGFLLSLSERDFRSGLAEVVKYGAIASSSLFRRLEQNVSEILRKDREVLATIIAESLAIKADVVEQDEKEGGLRAILNYGHTLGHAIEASAGYGAILHGEAIAMGMAWINDISDAVGGTALNDDAGRIKRLLDAFGLPVDYRPWCRAEVVELTAHDKKTRSETIELVLLQRLGFAERRRVPQDAFARVALNAAG